MRKVLLIVALVAASFAGGAVVNSPALAPIRALLEGRSPSGPIATIDDAEMARADVEAPEGVDAIPSAPPAPLELVDPPSRSRVDAPTSSKGVESESGSAFDSKGLAIVNSPVLDDPPSPTPIATTEAPSRPEAPVDPAVAPAGLGGERAGGSAWAEIRRRMAELGVSRYWIEGEPGGPARFRCVIPLAGRSAVGQQFEAEGDDDLRAAEATLRRVALWRATEAP